MVSERTDGTAHAATAPPKLSELGVDLLRVAPSRRALTLAAPFLCAALYVAFALLGWWPLAVAALMYLSFCTYGSISHDLVHRTLGLPARANEPLLAAIELLAIRSGHAYRAVHLHHHRRFPHDDDIEGAAARMTLARTLLDGMTLQARIYRWALARATAERGWIVGEGIICAGLAIAAIAIAPVTIIPLVYVVLMIAGSWIIPLITSYIPHDPAGAEPLRQTRLFRGKVLSVVALGHLYHLEHHLYPAVPHHNWPRLAKRLDPYFAEAGIEPVKLWF